jgi:hypothetical protein
MVIGLLACSGGPRAPQPSPASPAPTTDVGVPECDEYLRLQRACFAAKLAPEALAAANQTLEATRLKWRAMRTDPRTGPTLAMTCTIAVRESKPALEEMGCSS